MGLLNMAASAQGASRQAICQSSFEACLSHAQGKNWKPVYDRCVKTRSVCLGGMAYTPPMAAAISTSLSLNSASASDPANADPATSAAACENGQPRGTRDSCKLAQAGDGYGQNFSLAGPGVPMSRIQRVSSVVKCAGGALAQFYPNGRIASCTLDNSGGPGISLTDTMGKVITCAARTTAVFDPEGRLQSCN
jgi:hypothetical protein